MHSTADFEMLSDHNPIDIRAKRILGCLGISAMYIGCDYLRIAILEAYRKPDITEYVTKTLYPRIARLSGKKLSTVHRAMLRAVEHIRIHPNKAAVKEYLGSETAELDVGNIVTSIVHYLRREDGLE